MAMLFYNTELDGATMVIVAIVDIVFYASTLSYVIMMLISSSFFYKIGLRNLRNEHVINLVYGYGKHTIHTSTSIHIYTYEALI